MVPIHVKIVTNFMEVVYTIAVELQQYQSTKETAAAATVAAAVES
jgi:hypothetical protein